MNDQQLYTYLISVIVNFKMSVVSAKPKITVPLSLYQNGKIMVDTLIQTKTTLA